MGKVEKLKSKVITFIDSVKKNMRSDRSQEPGVRIANYYHRDHRDLGERANRKLKFFVFSL